MDTCGLKFGVYFLYLILFFPYHREVSSLGIFSNKIKSTAALLSNVSNTFSQQKTTQAFTNAARNAANKTLTALTDIENASAYTEFFLITRNSSGEFSEVYVGDTDALLKAGFSLAKPVKILIHGLLESKSGESMTTLREAFLEAEDLNVIIVDWHKLSRQLFSVAVTATYYVGSFVGTFLDFLVQDVGVDMSDIHVIGFSLGAHVSGVAGQHVSFGQLHRITGLDPSGLYLTSDVTKNRLDKSDALFVDVLHTSAGSIGYADPCGHLDVYFNGGFAPQPGCLGVICSHLRAYKYYAESISSKGFVATQCNSYESYQRGECAANRTAVIGYLVDNSLEGVWYLDTNSQSKYAKGDE